MMKFVLAASQLRSFLVAVFLICCASPLIAQEHSFKIGVISGLTGMAAKWNRFQNMGITLAKEELAQEGVNINLLLEDSQTQGAKVISAYRKLTGTDRVDAVIADDFGFAVAPLLPIVKSEKRLLITLSLPRDSYCQAGGGFMATLSSQFVDSRRAFESFFVLHPEVKRIALVVFDDPEWGNTYRRIWSEIAKERGIEIVDIFLNNESAPDFRSALTKILSKKPQAILVAHEPESFSKAYRQFGYKGYVLWANNVFEMLADAPNREDLNGTYVVDPVISADFRNRFEARFGTQPILEAYAGYEALKVLALALKTDRVHPEKAIKHIKYEGVAGPVDLTGESCAGNHARWGLFQFGKGGVIQQVPADSL